MEGALTRLQKSLRERLEKLHEDDALWQGFARAWADECGTAVVADPAALLADCLQKSPVSLSLATVAVAQELGKLATGAGEVPKTLRDVLIGICLVACERRVNDRCRDEGLEKVPNDMRIGVAQQLAAAVIAAVWSGNGLRLRFDDKDREPEVVNLMQDVPPVEFGFQDAKECVMAELQAMIKPSTIDLNSRDRLAALRQIREHGVQSEDFLVAQLEKYAKGDHARPMFGIATAAHHVLDDPELCAYVAATFKVPTFRYGGAVSDIDVTAWQPTRLQADLMSRLGELFEALYRSHTRQPEHPAPAASAVALGDMRFRVALSFAGEHRSYVSKVASALIDKLGRERVFYDDNYEALLAGPKGNNRLQKVYHDQTDLNVVFLGGNYQGSDWCGLEWHAVCDLVKKREEERVMYFKFDDGRVEGVFSIDIAIDCRKRTEAQAAQMILDRLQTTTPKTTP